jgi:hypothetical protein
VQFIIEKQIKKNLVKLANITQTKYTRSCSTLAHKEMGLATASKKLMDLYIPRELQ